MRTQSEIKKNNIRKANLLQESQTRNNRGKMVSKFGIYEQCGTQLDMDGEYMGAPAGTEPMDMMMGNDMAMGNTCPNCGETPCMCGEMGMDTMIDDDDMPMDDEMMMMFMGEGKKTKPDFLDLDGDGDKTEPMKKAAKDKMTEKCGGGYGKDLEEGCGDLDEAATGWGCCCEWRDSVYDHGQCISWGCKCDGLGPREEDPAGPMSNRPTGGDDSPTLRRRDMGKMGEAITGGPQTDFCCDTKKPCCKDPNHPNFSDIHPMGRMGGGSVETKKDGMVTNPQDYCPADMLLGGGGGCWSCDGGKTFQSYPCGKEFDIDDLFEEGLGKRRIMRESYKAVVATPSKDGWGNNFNNILTESKQVNDITSLMNRMKKVIK